MVVRFPPTEDDYLANLEGDFDAKIKFGQEHGFITKMLKKEKVTTGCYEGFRFETESKDGSHGIIVGLFDPDMPYQAIQIMVTGKATSVADDEATVDHILQSFNADFTVKVKLGTQDCVISKECQRNFIVTERHLQDSRDAVLLMQDPHWDTDGQWSLCQGLRVLFFENPHLAQKSAFLLEGIPTGVTLDASALTDAMNSPSPTSVNAILGTFLINGPVAFDWIEGAKIPLLGTENAALYDQSADAWLSGKDDAWTALVALRNQQIAASLIEARKKYDNPILFAGGMHLLPVDAKQFNSGSATLAQQTHGDAGRNRGVTNYLDDANIGYIYIEPGQLQRSQDRKLLDRYKALMTAERKNDLPQYVKSLATDFPVEAFSDGLDEMGGTTVSPSPTSAADLVNLLAAKASNGKKNAKDKKLNDKPIPEAKKEPVGRYDDPVSKADVKGTNMKKGEKALRDANPNLKKETNDKGRTEWKDPKTGQVRARYDPKGANQDAHWDKYAPDGTPIDNAGRPANKNPDGSYDRSIHIDAG